MVLIGVFVAENVFVPMHLTLARKNALLAVMCLSQLDLPIQKTALAGIALENVMQKVKKMARKDHA
jgi:hypothetical protein